MYQLEKTTTTTNRSVTICCELWKLLPPEEQEYQAQAETSIIELTFDQRPLKSIISEHLPSWTLGSWWTPELEDEF